MSKRQAESLKCVLYAIAFLFVLWCMGCASKYHFEETEIKGGTTFDTKIENWQTE